jgi:hypothetical protein
MSRIFTNSILILALAASLAAQVSTGQTPAQPKAPRHKKHAAVKKVEPSLPTRIAPMTPEQLPAQAPQVSYLNGQLTILSQNSTLADILNSVQKKTGVQIDLPPGGGSQRVATQIGPAAPRNALTTLLQGTNFDYIILGDQDHPGAVTKVVLTARESGASGANVPVARPGTNQTQAPPPPGYADPNNVADDEGTSEPPPESLPPDQMSREQPQPDAQQPQPGQPGAPGQRPGEMPPNAGQGPNGQIAIQGQQQQAKTPEQMLQELQQLRQSQQQQQAGNGEQQTQ